MAWGSFSAHARDTECNERDVKQHLKIVHEQFTYKYIFISISQPKSISEYYERKDLQHLTWFDQLAMRLAQTLSTHFLQVNLQELTDAYMRGLEKDGQLKLK